MGLSVLFTTTILLQPLSTLTLTARPSWVVTLTEAFAEARNKTMGSVNPLTGLMANDDLDLSDGLESTKELLAWIKSTENNGARIPALPEPEEETEESDHDMYKFLREELTQQERDLRANVLDDKYTDDEFDKSVGRDYERELGEHLEKDLEQKDTQKQGPTMNAEKNSLKQDMAAMDCARKMEVLAIGKLYKPHFRDQDLEFEKDQKAQEEDLKMHYAGKGFRAEYEQEVFVKHPMDKFEGKDVKSTMILADGKDLKTTCEEKTPKMRVSEEIKPISFFA
jgi:hypothetical protein